MNRLETSLNTRGAEFQENRAHLEAQVKDLRETLAAVRQGGGEKARTLHTSRGKLLARDRVDALLDPGSPFLELSALAALDVYGEDVPAAGIVTGAGLPPDGGGDWSSAGFSVPVAVRAISAVESSWAGWEAV